jgi:hypothetical protein
MFLGNSQQAALRTGSVIDQHGLESFPNSFPPNSRTKGFSAPGANSQISWPYRAVPAYGLERSVVAETG